MSESDEAGPWLPGMEPPGVEVRKQTPKRKRAKKRVTKDVVPLEMQLTPGGPKILVYAEVERPENGRDIRRR